MSSIRTHRAELLALIAYLVLAVLLTFPLVLHFTTHVPGDGGDDPALAWNLWWVPHALLDLNTNPLDTNYLFYPIGLDLAFYTLTPLNDLLAIPFQFAFNLVVASNANLLLSFVLSGFGAYLLAKHEIRGLAASRGHAEAIAFAAGAVYAFSSNKLLYAALGQFNIASSQWIPFYVLFLKLQVAGSRFQVPGKSIRLGFLLGLFLLFQALSEFIFASFLILFTGAFLISWLISQRRSGPSPLFRASTHGTEELTTGGESPVRGRATPSPLGEGGEKEITGGYAPGPPGAKPNRLFPGGEEGVGERALWPPLLGLLTAAIVFVVPMAPILAAMLKDLWAEGDFIQQGLGFADVFSNDLVGFFVPSRLHPLLGALQAQFHFAYTTNFAYLGFAALAVAALALWKMGRARLWGLWGALFFLLTLGPELRVNGQVVGPPILPFNLLLQIPLIKGNRYPSRWSVMLTLALAVLVAYGLAYASKKAQGKMPARFLLLPAAFLFITLFEHLSVPLPLSDFRIPEVYKTIAADQGDFSVLEIPLAWRNGFRVTGPLDAEMMFEQWYQTEHRHPILGGNTSRNPELKFQYFTEAPVINSLLALETGYPVDRAQREADRQLAPEVLRLFGVKYVVWHSPRNEANTAALNAARAYVEETWPVTKFYDVSDEAGETVAYRVKETEAPLVVNVSPVGGLGRLYLAEGWGALGEPTVWAQRDEARVLFRLDDRGRGAVLSLGGLPPPTLDEQPVRVFVNGELVGRTILAQCRECKPPLTFPAPQLTIPARLLRAGVNEMVLRFDRLVPAKGNPLATGDPWMGGYKLGSNVPQLPVNIVIRSAGQDQGDFAHIYVGGQDVSQNGRGYNLAVLNPATGAVEASASFDTFASEAEARRLARFVEQVPEGRVVLVAVRDEASRHLTAEAVQALQTIGAQQDLRGKFRWSHAIIGIKGATPGSVHETASQVAPAQLVLGIGATEPNLAAAFEWIRIEAK